MMLHDHQWKASRLRRITSLILLQAMLVSSLPCFTLEAQAFSESEEQVENAPIEFSLEEVWHLPQTVSASNSATHTKSLSNKWSTLSAQDTQNLFTNAMPMPVPLLQAASNIVLPSQPRPELKEKALSSALHRAAKSITNLEGSKESNIAPIPLEARINHSGNTNEVRQLTITFSQPMVDLDLIETQTGNSSSFAKITPQPPGEWKWLGTKTLTFVSSSQFPKATNYKIAIPRTVHSLTGSTFEQEQCWNISLPAPEITALFPRISDQGQCQTPVIVAFFNQKISETEILQKCHVCVGTRQYKTQLVSRQELQSLVQTALEINRDRIKLPRTQQSWLNTVDLDTVQKLMKGNFVAFRLVEQLPKAATIQITFDKGLSSTEGPKTNKQTCKFQFKTFEPLQLVSTTAENIEKNINGGGTVDYIAPLAAFKFNNRLLQSEIMSNDWISINPKPSRYYLTTAQNKLYVHARFRPLSHYKVTFKTEIEDTFGQHLKAEQKGEIKTSTIAPKFSQDDFKSYASDHNLIHKFYVSDATKVRVTIRRVQPEDWLIFNEHNREPNLNLGSFICSKEFSVNPEGENISIDLKPYMTEKYGHFLIVRESITEAKNPKSGKSYPPAYGESQWIQITDLALDAFNPENLHVIASALKDGSRLSNIKLFLAGTNVTATTDANGHANMDTPKTAGLAVPLIGKNGNDSCIVTVLNYGRLHDAQSNPYLISALSDRKLYRPGETIAIIGIVRKRLPQDNVQTGLNFPGIKTLKYHFLNDHYQEISSGDIPVDSKGNFNLSIKSPDKYIGNASVAWELKDQLITHIFSDYNETVRLSIEEFRKPNFETSVTSDKPSLLPGESAVLTSQSRYLSGGALSNASDKWVVKISEHYFSPPGWHLYSFSDTRFLKFKYLPSRKTPEWALKSITTNTNKTGQAQIKLTAPTNLDRDVSLSCESTVTDANRHNWTGKAELIAHPSTLCIGIKEESGFTDKKAAEYKIVATDLNGNIQTNKTIEVTFTEKTSDSVTLVEQKKSIVSTDQPGSITYQPGERCESLTVTARGTDEAGRHTLASTHTYRRPSFAEDGQMANRMGIKAELFSDKQTYLVGEVARLKLHSSIFPAQACLIVKTNTSTKITDLKIEGPDTNIDLPITENQYPGPAIAAMIDAGEKGYSETRIMLSVPPENKKLQLTLAPSAINTSPARDTTIDINLKNHGQPVEGGRVSIAVVDDAILSLAKYRWLDPTPKFYRLPYLDSQYRRSREQQTGLWITVCNSRIIAGRIGESGGPDDSDTEMPAGQFRKNFQPLAYFNPSIATDKNGNAQVRFILPQSVTRYSVMALAQSGPDKFGFAETNITTSLPLMVKPSPPRFLNCGDVCDLSVIFQNNTGEPLTTEVALRSNNAEVKDGGKLVTIPANDRLEISFPVKVNHQGDVTFQCLAKAGDLSDAAEFVVPVRTPASSETVATYGVLDSDAILENIVSKPEVIKDFGGLSLSMSSSAIDSLTDSCDYLRNYPYDCTEQVSSRLLAMLSLQDQLIAFGILKTDQIAVYKAQIESDIALLSKRQNNDGAFGIWQAQENTKWPFVTIQATEALLLAEIKSYRVNDATKSRALKYLKTINGDVVTFSREAQQAIVARALNVRHKASKQAQSKVENDDVIANAQKLFEEITGCKVASLETNPKTIEIPTETAAWLLTILRNNAACGAEAKFLRNYIASQIDETSSTASVNSGGYGASNYSLFFSPKRADAVVLDALIEDQPQSSLIPKLVKGLLSARKNGIWQGTQENSCILQALDHYFSIYEKDVPKFTALSWLNDTLIADEKFQGRSLKTQSIRLPMEYLLKNLHERQGAKSSLQNQVLISKEGPGRLYYRLALDYANKDLNLKSIEHGFDVHRTYHAIDDEKDLRRDANGSMHIKAGATIRVKVRFKNNGTRFHVALVDPLPAGAEALNSKLGGSSTLSLESTIDQSEQGKEKEENLGPGTEWTQGWFDHESLRDHQVEAFAPLISSGNYEYTYLMRATSKGTYTVPPAKVEEMYSPESFGRTNSDTVIVE